MFRVKLRELREAAGYRSQQAFGDAFGVAQSTVGNWEAGAREPNYETTMRLADFFGVTVDDIMGREDEKKSTPVSEGGHSDDELVKMWKNLTPDEILRVKDFAQGMIANRKEPHAH